MRYTYMCLHVYVVLWHNRQRSRRPSLFIAIMWSTSKEPRRSISYLFQFFPTWNLGLCCWVHLSIHWAIGSVPVVVQCPLTSSLGEFPGYWDWLWCSGLSPVLVSIAFPFTFLYLGVFQFTLLHLPAIEFVIYCWVVDESSFCSWWLHSKLLDD